MNFNKLTLFCAFASFRRLHILDPYRITAPVKSKGKPKNSIVYTTVTTVGCRLYKLYTSNYKFKKPLQIGSSEIDHQSKSCTLVMCTWVRFPNVNIGKNYDFRFHFSVDQLLISLVSFFVDIRHYRHAWSLTICILWMLFDTLKSLETENGKQQI